VKRLLIALAALFCVAAASDPTERLADPAQETRARALFKEVRCLICQNEAIDDSSADFAKDVRLVIREQIAAGRSDAEVKRFLTDRYGEYVLFRPRFSGANLALWITPFLVLLIGAGLLVARLRNRPTPEALSPEEEAALARLTRDGRD
jgi:cytochrome c-type biogenesis protein CcmH